MSSLAELGLARQQTVVEIPSTATIVDAFRILVDNKILSAPVYDAETNTYKGFFDCADMNSYVVDTIVKARTPGGPEEVPFELSDLSELLTFVSRVHSTALEAVVNLSTMNPFHCLEPSATLRDATELLAGGAHRVAVVDPGTKRVTSILSQSSIIQFLAENAKNPLMCLAHKSLRDAGLGAKKVLSVSMYAKAFHGLQVLNDNKLSGIAVVDPADGKLVTSLSTSDLRTVVSRLKFDFANGTDVIAFVQQSRTLDGAMERPAVCVARDTDSVVDVLKRLAKAHLHRLYLVDDNRRPVGVVSLKDLLRYLLAASTD